MTHALTIETAQQNIGKEVVFIDATKPYTNSNGERIAMKLLEIHEDIDLLDHVFKGITGK